MLEHPPLYKDNKITIDYSPIFVGDHRLSLKEKDGKTSYYNLQRGTLHELAITPPGGIEKKINNFNPSLLDALNKEEITIDALHIALCQAYIEEEVRRIHRIKLRESRQLLVN